ncbi:MAG: GlyGly-CTERM sorting domain-containing protein [Granulosicoccus sp.]
MMRFINLSKRVLIGTTLLLSSYIHADTFSYLAITDFPNINAGDVPYYVDSDRQALGIDAAVVEYRDRFAKAEVVFDGQPGLYQFTLVAFAENDGEADYRLSINGEIVGLVSNPEVGEPFAEVRHEFADISVPAGAVIAVESLANSNGKIPENGEFAFARGRWKALELSATEDENSDPDLRVNGGVDNQQPTVGDTVELSLTVGNAVESDVATGVVVLVSLPTAGLELADQSVCSSTVTGIECSVPELPAGESVNLSVNLRATAELSESQVVISVGADQTDRNQADNSLSISLSVTAEELIDPVETTPPEGEVEVVETQTETGADRAGSETAISGENENQTDSNMTTSATTESSANSSGGAISLFIFLGLMACLMARRPRPFQTITSK